MSSAAARQAQCLERAPKIWQIAREVAERE
jgi:hypothetical protein